MLRTTIQRNHNIDINYLEVTSLLKKSAVGYRSQKYVFQANEIQRFFSEAMDFEFLAIKVRDTGLDFKQYNCSTL